MSVYMIIDIEVTDEAVYAEYVARVPAVVARHGGRYLARGPATPLAGGWTPQRIIVIEFLTQEDLRTCFASAEYAEIAPLRERSAVGRSIAIESCPPIP